jgi:hypothetical protein
MPHPRPSASPPLQRSSPPAPDLSSQVALTPGIAPGARCPSVPAGEGSGWAPMLGSGAARGGVKIQAGVCVCRGALNGRRAKKWGCKGAARARRCTRRAEGCQRERGWAARGRRGCANNCCAAGSRPGRCGQPTEWAVERWVWPRRRAAGGKRCGDRQRRAVREGGGEAAGARGRARGGASGRALMAGAGQGRARRLLPAAQVALVSVGRGRGACDRCWQALGRGRGGAAGAPRPRGHCGRKAVIGITRGPCPGSRAWSRRARGARRRCAPSSRARTRRPSPRSARASCG